MCCAHVLCRIASASACATRGSRVASVVRADVCSVDILCLFADECVPSPILAIGRRAIFSQIDFGQCPGPPSDRGRQVRMTITLCVSRARAVGSHHQKSCSMCWSGGQALPLLALAGAGASSAGGGAPGKTG